MRYDNIYGLRGILILIVVIFHLGFLPSFIVNLANATFFLLSGIFFHSKPVTKLLAISLIVSYILYFPGPYYDIMSFIKFIAYPVGTHLWFIFVLILFQLVASKLQAFTLLIISLVLQLVTINPLYNYMLLFLPFFCIGILYKEQFINLIEQLPSMRNKYLISIGNNSLWIYLLHPYILTLIQFFYINLFV